MVIKKNYAITILELEKIQEMNSIILKHAKITMHASSDTYFDTQTIDSDETEKDMTFFQMESEDEASLDKEFKEMTEELNQLTIGYAIRDEDTGEMPVFLKFVGKLDIKFDNVKFINEGTYAKIDELKSFKTELGICKGYKPQFRPIEGKSIEDMNNDPESIYLLCKSQENLMKLSDLMSEKVKEIDPDLEPEFKQFGGKEEPNFNKDINCLNLDSSNAILKKIEKEK